MELRADVRLPVRADLPPSLLPAPLHTYFGAPLVDWG